MAAALRRGGTGQQRLATAPGPVLPRRRRGPGRARGGGGVPRAGGIRRRRPAGRARPQDLAAGRPPRTAPSRIERGGRRRPAGLRQGLRDPPIRDPSPTRPTATGASSPSAAARRTRRGAGRRRHSTRRWLGSTGECGPDRAAGDRATPGDRRSRGLRDRDRRRRGHSASAGLRQPSAPVFIPHAQAPKGAMTYVVRTIGDPAASIPAIQSVVWDAAPYLAFYSVAKVEQLLSDTLAARRFTTPAPRAVRGGGPRPRRPRHLRGHRGRHRPADPRDR